MQWHAAAHRVQNLPSAGCRQPFHNHTLVILPGRQLNVLTRGPVKVLHIRQGNGTQPMTARRERCVLQHPESHSERPVGLTLKRAKSGQVLSEPERRAERDASSIAQAGEREVGFFDGERIEQTERAVEQRLAHSGTPATARHHRHSTMLPLIESRCNAALLMRHHQ